MECDQNWSIMEQPTVNVSFEVKTTIGFHEDIPNCTFTFDFALSIREQVHLLLRGINLHLSMDK